MIELERRLKENFNTVSKGDGQKSWIVPHAGNSIK